MIRLLALASFTCLVQASSVLALSGPLPPADKITYSEQIAPLVYGHCSMCHRPGLPLLFRC